MGETVRVLMYCTHICPYCNMADRLLERKGVKAEKIHVDDLPEQRAEMVRITGRTTVPQIFIGKTHVGGYTDLAELERSGKLDTLLVSPS
ncbi:MAG: glutaredoxin 3 [Gammaproteobacteria bacterium]|nr:glutaredoxin 3 [Gammaproteobacteria bacterium]